MGTSLSRPGTTWGLLPTLVATALLLAGCGGTTTPGATSTDTTTTSMTPLAPTTSPAPTTSAGPATSPGTTTSATKTTPTTPTTSASGESSPSEAIEAWLDTQGHDYAGECAETTIEDDIGKYCSSLCEDRGDQQIYKVGPTFSEYTTWLLVEQSSGGWSVVDTARDTGTAPAPW